MGGGKRRNLNILLTRMFSLGKRLKFTCQPQPTGHFPPPPLPVCHLIRRHPSISPYFIPVSSSQSVSSPGNHRPKTVMPFKAVLFDMGGVLVRYRDPTSYERLLEMAGEDPEVAKQIKEFDYGRVSAEEIAPLMRLILPDFPQGVTEYSALENYTKPNEEMFRVIRRLKARGLKVALVTNNGFWSPARERTMLLGDISPFDLVVESCKVGIRKPDSEIFNLAVQRLKVAKEECIFLDDSKDNCEGAEREGIRAIYVENGNTHWAMTQLEHLLGISLSGRAALVTLGCEMNLTEGQVQIIEQH